MEFKKSRLFNLSNKKILANILAVDKKTLKHVDLEYKPYKLPEESSKVNGKVRNLYNPNRTHKRALKRLTKHLMDVNIPEYVYGGIKERSHIQNAAVHREKKYLMLIDIKDFFPSTSDKYVYDLFINDFKMAPDLAKILTNLVTIPYEDENKEGRYLPQGYPTSPILSYLSYEKMYKKLKVVADENEMEFTCYYDDLTFSSNKFINKSLKRKVNKIIRSYQFEIHPTKSKVMIKKGVEVTGVFLDESNRIHAPKKLLQKLQDSYEEVKKLDAYSNDFGEEYFIDVLNRFQGLISAVKSIEKERKLDLFENKLKYMRRKYKVPYRQ